VTIDGGKTAPPPTGGISVAGSLGGFPSAANLGINTGGTLTTDKNPVRIEGTYYKHTGNPADNLGGSTVISGGTVQSAAGDTTISNGMSSATSASADLNNPALNPPSQTLGIINSTQTITGGAGRNVINVTQINLGSGMDLTLNAPANASFVINVTGSGASGGITLAGASSDILLTGGITPANVIFNVVPATGTENVSVTDSTVNATVMDLTGNVTLTSKSANATVNGEVISGGAITLMGGDKGVADVEVVAGVLEPSAAAYFTLGPVSLIAVMLLHRRFSRRKRTIVRGSHDPPESLLGTVKWC
jgi:hypothetical protein